MFTCKFCPSHPCLVRFAALTAISTTSQRAWSYFGQLRVYKSWILSFPLWHDFHYYVDYLFLNLGKHNIFVAHIQFFSLLPPNMLSDINNIYCNRCQRQKGSKFVSRDKECKCVCFQYYPFWNGLYKFLDSIPLCFDLEL